MSTNAFSSQDLAKIYGQTFDALNIGDGSTSVPFSIYDKTQARTRKGAEAFGVFVDCHHPRRGKLPSFLKIFMNDIPERRERTDFLIRTGLAQSHEWMFHGVPYAWLPGSFVGQQKIVGHVALQIGTKFGFAAEDFFRLKGNSVWGDSQSKDVRNMLAAQLCCAVAAMEKIGLVHGDLSSGNVMVGPGPSGKSTCTLVDFDGYDYRGIAPLPRKFEQIPCRPLGTAGYQYPEIADKVTIDRNGTDSSIVVKSDRFALGALVCELITWSPKFETSLGRYEILSSDDIKSRSLSSLPNDVTNAWPVGFALLEKALNAGSTAAFPSPEDWLQALGNPVLIQTAFQNKPHLKIFKRSGSRLKLEREAMLSNATSGSLVSIAPELRDVEYALIASKLTFRINWPHPVFLIDDKRNHFRGQGPTEIAISPGQAISSNGWEIQVLDIQPV